MIETPGQFGEYPSDDLRTFCFHTGATLRRLDDDEPCPVLFRDVGLDGMRLFLRGGMGRLAGPLSPITYARTADYAEPYRDHGRIGRLLLLRPMELRPWHSGVPTIYVARASRMASPETIVYVPADVPLTAAAELAATMCRAEEFREAFAGREYDDRAEDALCRINRLSVELERTERRAAPLRRALQSPDDSERESARDAMKRLGLSESDLCTAYHHLARERREVLLSAFAGSTDGVDGAIGRAISPLPEYRERVG
jgi:hypothetical protein